MTFLIVIGAVVILGVIIAVVVGLRRSHSAKSSWLGELDEIRRSSLVDDHEVTGALEAVAAQDARQEDETVEGSVESDAVTSEGEPAATHHDAPTRIRDDAPPEDEVQLELRAVTDAPDRTVSDAGTRFNEYRHSDGVLLRVEVTDPPTVRVLESTNEAATRFAVDLRSGVLWHRTSEGEAAAVCTVHTPAGWVLTTGTVLVLVDTRWSFVMCLDGRSHLRIDDAAQFPLTAGQIARFTVGDPEVEIADVGRGTLETEGVVRRQRRLDEAVAS